MPKYTAKTKTDTVIEDGEELFEFDVDVSRDGTKIAAFVQRYGLDMPDADMYYFLKEKIVKIATEDYAELERVDKEDRKAALTSMLDQVDVTFP